MPDYSDIEYYANKILGPIVFNADRRMMESMSGNMRSPGERYLLLEGTTDRNFFQKIVAEDVVCYAASDFVVSNTAFKESETKKPLSVPNPVSCKKAIYRLLYGKEKARSYVRWPKGTENINPYGVIDRDFDKDSKYDDIERLIITFTHDLEMMIIATDRQTVFSRIPDCKIEPEDVKKAECMAYQVAKIRHAVREYAFQKKVKISDYNLVGDVGLTSYESFSNGAAVNAFKAVDHILDAYPKLEKTERETHKNGILRFLTDSVNKNGEFKYTYNDFDPYETEGFFKEVNGHDYLAALAYLNEDANCKYSKKTASRLNRMFESDLIQVCDYKKMKLNPTIKRMKELKLLKEF